MHMYRSTFVLAVQSYGRFFIEVKFAEIIIRTQPTEQNRTEYRVSLSGQLLRSSITL